MPKTENQGQHLSLIEKKMSKGIIIHLDNDLEGILKPSKNLFDQYGLNLDYITCESKEDFEKVIKENQSNIKALIFDLLSSEPDSAELNDSDAEFMENIDNSFSKFNIPIFVYSGFLQALNGKYENQGTLFKIDKAENEIKVIFDKIGKFFNSGFLDVFSPNGKLNELLYNDLHLSFTKQFTNNSQIEGIIDSINGVEGAEAIERVQRVFQRIALRSLMSNLLAPELDQETNLIKPDFLNPVEHYLQRISPFKFWTGDIFQKKDQTECYIIITPRCDFASKNLESFLVCELIVGEFPNKVNADGKDKIGKALNDNPLFSGYSRFIPPCALFNGGKIELSKYKMINRDELSQNFERIISLSDELTNEILGKFGAYFFRSGINPFNKDETIAHITNVLQEINKQN